MTINWTMEVAGYYTATIDGEDVVIKEVFEGGYGWRLEAADNSWMNDRAPSLKEAKLDAEAHAEWAAAQ